MDQQSNRHPWRSSNTHFVKNSRPTKEGLSINQAELSIDATSLSKKFEDVKIVDKLDDAMGFDRFDSGPKKIGWLVNMHSVRCCCCCCSSLRSIEG